jgi:histidyl-tRNA synthetase
MSATKVLAPRGVADILPDTVAAWQTVEATTRRLFARFGFSEIRTPMFEHTDLFIRGVGEDTDIVAKEMYTFTDRGGRSVTLRPEGTAGVVRAYLERGLHAGPQPAKLGYVSAPMFRYDRPETGRYRQFHQMGVEVLGSGLPVADAEVVTLAQRLIEESGLTGATVRLNSVGDAVCRPEYRLRLRAYYEPHLSELCADCKVRYERNPLRLLDCKQPSCTPFIAGAPTVLDSLCDGCRAHLEGVQAFLTAAGVPYALDPTIVRGLDYYTRTVFEVVHPTLGALCGGGRYDNLVEQLGGPPTAAVGFALGVERLLLALREAGVEPLVEPPTVFVVCAAETLQPEAFRLATAWREAGIAVEIDLMGRSFRAQMRQADRLQARYVAVLGPDEAARGAVSVRDMRTGNQEEVDATGVVAWLEARRGA